MCGLVSIAPQRLKRLTINKNERNKLLKELAMADVLARHGYRVHLVDEDPRTGSYNALINGIPADFKRTASRDFSPNRRKIIGRANECGTCLVAPPAEIGGRRKSVNVRSLSAAFCLAAIWRFPLSEEGCHKKASINKDLYH